MLLLFAFIQITYSQLLQVDALIANKTIPAFKNEKTSIMFDPTQVQASTCSQNQLLLIPKEFNSINFTIQNLGIYIYHAHQKLDDVTRQIRVHAFPLNSETLKIKNQFEEEIALNDEINIKLEFQCLDNYWSYVDLVIYDEDKDDVQLQFVKFCDKVKSYTHPIIILATISIILVTVGSIYGQKRLIIMGEEQSEEFGMKPALMFIFVASGALLLLYYLANYIIWILLVWILFVGLFALSNLIMEIIELFINEQINLKLPFIGNVTVIQIISAAISLFFVIEYLLTRNWLLSNLLALAITLMMFRVLKIIAYNYFVIEVDSFRTVTVLLSLAFIYDIFWVFYSHYFFGESVMASVATKIDLPMKFLCPPLFTDEQNPFQRCSLIGLGDIILPGILVKYSKKFDNHIKSNRFLITGVISYSIGLILCMVCLLIFELAQPALLYLVPCLLLGLSYAGYREKCLYKYWIGDFKKAVDKDYELASDQL